MPVNFMVDFLFNFVLQFRHLAFDLTKGLVRLDKNSIYPMVDRLLRLVITLLISTATTARVFLAVKLTKTCMLHYFVKFVMIEFIRQYI